MGLINYFNDPLNWYDCQIAEKDHAMKIVELCKQAGIRVEAKENSGLNIFIFPLQMEEFNDLVNIYTTINHIRLDISCITPVNGASDTADPVPVQQMTAFISEYDGMVIATARFETGAVTMCLTDDELVADRITDIVKGSMADPEYVRFLEDDNSLKRDCAFSGEYVTDDMCCYVYAGN